MHDDTAQPEASSPEPQAFFTVSEVADLARCCGRIVREAIAAGSFPRASKRRGKGDGHTWLLSRAEVRAWVGQPLPGDEDWQP